MPKVLCEWDYCKYNDEGRCECPDEVKLVDVCGSGKGSLMDCKTFEWGDWEEDE